MLEDNFLYAYIKLILMQLKLVHISEVFYTWDSHLKLTTFPMKIDPPKLLKYSWLIAGGLRCDLMEDG